MNFLKRERAELAARLPGLDEQLAGIPLMEMERPGSPAIALFRTLGGTSLVIPEAYGGIGATPLAALRIQRAIGSRSPSLAIATCMHHFSLATLVEMAAAQETPGLEALVLGHIASNKLYVASGFAEGRTGQNVLTSAMEVEPIEGGFRVNGCKRPCSLAASMDLLTVSLSVPSKNASGKELAVAVLESNTAGLERRPYWSSPVLAGAESDEIVLKDVEVHEQQIARFGTPESLDVVQLKGFVWFELLITASYMGIGTALVESVLQNGKGPVTERVEMTCELEAAMSALENVAKTMPEDDCTDVLPRLLMVRYSVQRTLERIVVHAAELHGGMAYIGSENLPYLVSAAGALAFHPPSRLSMAPALNAWLLGEPLSLG